MCVCVTERRGGEGQSERDRETEEEREKNNQADRKLQTRIYIYTIFSKNPSLEIIIIKCTV